MWRNPVFVILALAMFVLGGTAPAQTPPPQQTARLPLAFDGDSAELSADGRSQLTALAPKIPPGEWRIEIRAWGSAAGGSVMDARRLSLNRAMAARDLLVAQGVAPGRITMRPLGRMPGGGANNQLEILYRGPE